MRRAPSSVRTAVVQFAVGCSAAVALASCMLLPDSTLPNGSQRFTPPPAYATWWSQVEQCSGRTGSYAAVSWYQVPGADQFTINGETWDGHWSPIGNRVVLAGNLVTSGSLVRHEMLHALLGSSGHPRSAFIDACAGVVDCSSNCVAEAGSGPPPDPSWVTVPPESLQVGATIAPVRPGSAVNGGAFAMTVTVTNASNRGVVVALPPSGDAGPPGSFSWEAKYPSVTAWYDERAWDPSVTYFAPGETKRMIFDFFVNGPSAWNGLPAGVVSFRYRYGEVWQGPIVVTLDP